MSKNKDLLEAINGYTRAWKELFNSSNPADQYEETGIAMRWEDSKFPFSNAAFLTNEISDSTILKQRLETVVARMKKKENGGLLNICNDLITGEAATSFDQILKDVGLAYVMPLNGMAGDILPLEPKPIKGLEIKRVTTTSEFNDFSDMNCLAYGFDIAWGRTGLGNVWIDNAYSFVGYVDNQPVCAASTAQIDNVLYLALVATLPNAQRKGYSEAIVRHALIEGHKATGLKRTLLHATPAGAPVYERIGYYKSANISAYQLNSSDE
ncbi:GNAT family N-acetyltransferase [Acinetobacter colistiniresistens]|uniref:GNAT family N-acetyltransferase n=1 Tax=Acinetobacter colistiniresistens TaxID=280145 RepID=UPI00211CE886|nr:GNAT family N-acetyltransferase [Acinetobacter colistiniresistens]UUM26657.1 GNAT family N-acetyltransferase [Acinetobacter colistiniresistens]